jgi:TonB-linked SusC/RagA family outer membrane protein
MAGSTGFNTVWRLNATGYLILSPLKGLNVEATFNYSPTFTDKSSYSRQNGYWDYVTDERFSESALEKASITNSSARTWQQSAEVVARYNTTINKAHDLGAMLGFSSMEYMSKSFSISRQGATDWALHELSTYETLTSSSSSSPAKWGLNSYFGRVNYAYKSRYLLEANLRADGSSRFGSDNRWGWFPSFSAGWRLMEESFMENLSDTFSNLKLRASWGRMGNNSIGNYDWMANYVTGNVVMDGSGSKGLYRSSLSNSKLHWETTTTTDIGLDFGFFDNRLTGEVDWYNKYTTDILYHPATYLTMGVISSAPANLGKVRNRGVEVSLNWRDKIGKEFQYNAGVNFSYNDNKVLKFKGVLNKYWSTDADGNKVSYVNNFSDVAESGFGGYISEGRKLGETYMYRVYHGTGEGYTGGAVDVNAGPKDGMIRTEEDMKWVKAMIDSGYKFGGMSTISKDQLWYGDRLYADRNGDGNYGDTNDRDFTGHSYVPLYNLGINLGASYKNIDLSMVWSGAFGHYLSWTTSYYNTTLISHGYGIIQHIADDHYFYDPTNPDDARTNINGKYTRLTYGTVNNNNLQSDWNEYKANYLKLKNVQLGYTLPQSFTKKFCVGKLRAFVSMDNILTITSYPGMDPEIGTSIGYPLMRQISFGGQITF